MSKTSKKRKKKFAIKEANDLKKSLYRKLPADKKLMRFLKENGLFISFVNLVRKKHRLGFQSAIRRIKGHPDIMYLIGHYYTYNNVIYLDDYANSLINMFNKYKPIG